MHAGSWFWLIGVGTFAVGPVAAQDQAEAETAAAWAKVAEPGPEHERLDLFVGRWTLEGTYWTAPGAKPRTITGEMQSRWVLGNRFVLAEGTIGSEAYRILELMGYDNLKRQYVTISASTMFTAIHQSVGTCDPSGKTFTFTSAYVDPVTGTTKNTRQTIEIRGPDRHVAETYDEGPDGHEFKTLTMTFTRGPRDTTPAADQDLALVQGIWTNTYRTGGSTIRAVRRIEGNRETLTRYAGDRVVSAASVAFRLERRKDVKIFTFFNLEVTEGPQKGHKDPTEQSYLYHVDHDSFTEVWGLIEGDLHAPEMIVWRRAEGTATQPAQEERDGLLKSLLRAVGASRENQ
jgi:hypothetical protein